MSEITLKPCPFCGGEAKFHEGTDAYSTRDHRTLCFVSCKDDYCGGKAATFVYRKESERENVVARAIAAWNHRATPNYCVGDDFSTELHRLKDMLTLTPEIEKQLNRIWDTYEWDITAINAELYEEKEKNRTGGWISINERQPGDSNWKIIAYYADGHLKTDQANYKDGHWSFGSLLDGEYVYWLDSPEPPTPEESK